MKQGNLPGIDIFRAVAIVAVILIHVAPVRLDNNSLFVGQIGRFCVPLFVALSGFGLARKYLEMPFDLSDFVKRRIWRLVPQYILWSLVIYVSINTIFRQDIGMYSRQTFGDLLIFGKADYQLYFVPMIVTLYVLFPLVFFIARRWPTGVLLVTFLGQSWWYQMIVTKPGFWTDQDQYRNALTWIFYFVLGVYLAMKRLPDRAGFWLATAVGAGLVIMEHNTFSLLAAGVNPLIATEFTNFPIMFYATMVILLAVYVSSKISFPHNIWVNGLVQMGKISYIVYLSHTLVLRFLYNETALLKIVGVVPFDLVMIAASFILAEMVYIIPPWISHNFNRAK